MPYRRRYRRSYGRRRRYGRRQRRPNASRAVPRTSFAPRHQYLKLKTAFQLVAPSPGAGVTTQYRLRIDNAYEPEQSSTPVGWVWNGDHAPLGWNAYGSLFQRYVVHGLKVEITPELDLAAGNASENISARLIWAITTESTSSRSSDALREMPISGMVQVTPGRNQMIKRYFNMNRIMGQSVAKHDRYYRDWGDTTSAEAFLTVEVGGSIQFTNRLYTQLTWYISAVSSNARAGDPAAFAALKSMTVPFYGGDQPDPLAEEIQTAISTGVTKNKRALAATGLGGTA